MQVKSAEVAKVRKLLEQKVLGEENVGILTQGFDAVENPEHFGVKCLADSNKYQDIPNPHDKEVQNSATRP